ncbi:MAG: MarR family transcriptional regulator [Burkholderiales bacterium]|nr:MarR family transcriptional regulator [Burkholderiales bacterium]
MTSNALSKKEFETLSDFRYQLRRFLRFSEEAVHSHGLTHLQYLLILHVKGYQGREWATIGELAEKLQAHHHGVVSLVSRCEKLGLVYRQQGRTDKREVEVHLTPEGNRMVEKLARLHRDELVGSTGRFRVPGADELRKGD